MLLFCFLGILIPFIGTCFGSFLVFFLGKKLSFKVKKILTGFAIGVMLAASIWSLIIPSLEMVDDSYTLVWVPAVVGLFCGVLFLLIINKYSDRILKTKTVDMLVFSVGLHNIPEGMAVGVCFAGVLAGNSSVSLLGAFVLALGIAVQNIPEGAIVSMPMQAKGVSKFKSFMIGVLSGIVEPIAAFLTILLVNYIVPVLPYLLSFAAGAMIYVIFDELVLELHDNIKSNCGIISVIVGFSIMMILDIMLG